MKKLIALYFQFGRYLLMSSSRRGSMTVNLWGKWVNDLDPACNAAVMSSPQPSSPARVFPHF